MLPIRPYTYIYIERERGRERGREWEREREREREPGQVANHINFICHLFNSACIRTPDFAHEKPWVLPIRPVHPVRYAEMGGGGSEGETEMNENREMQILCSHRYT